MASVQCIPCALTPIFDEENTGKMDCSICMEVIGEKNCSVTECGHKYHTDCLLNSVVKTGPGCLLCRHSLIELPKEEDEDDEDLDDDDDDFYWEDATEFSPDSDFEEEPLEFDSIGEETDSLNSFRWMWQRLELETEREFFNNEEDALNVFRWMWQREDWENEMERENIDIPVNYIADFIQRKNIPYHQLAKFAVSQFTDELDDEESDEFEEYSKIIEETINDALETYSNDSSRN